MFLPCVSVSDAYKGQAWIPTRRLVGSRLAPDSCAGGGRAAARVKTHRRRKVYPVPEEILAMFSGEETAIAATGSMAARSGTSYEATVNRLASIRLEFTSTT
jgi:hypothetical protein